MKKINVKSTPFGTKKPEVKPFGNSHRKTSSPYGLPVSTGGLYSQNERRPSKMNKRGNVILGLLFFIMALGVLVVFISPINDFVDLMQQSDSLNCKGFIYNGDSTHTLSFNETSDGGASGSPLACLSLKLYLPYILLVFLVGGLSAVLAGKAGDWFGVGGGGEEY